MSSGKNHEAGVDTWCPVCRAHHPRQAPAESGRAYLVREGVLSRRSCVGCRRVVLGFAFVSSSCSSCAHRAAVEHLADVKGEA